MTAIIARVNAALGRVTQVRIGRHAWINVYPDVPSSLWPAFGNPCDFAEMTVWRRSLHPSDLFIDVGAHLGFYTLEALDLGAEVIAIEPSPTLLPLLKANIDLNGFDGLVVPIAVADVKGVSYLGGPDLSRGAIGQVEGFEVPTVTLDEIIGDRTVAGVKVDVEGAELAVLQGASRALGEKRIGLLQLEWITKSDRSVLVDILSAHGYELLAPSRLGRLSRLADPVNAEVWNVFARPVDAQPSARS